MAKLITFTSDLNVASSAVFRRLMLSNIWLSCYLLLFLPQRRGGAACGGSGPEGRGPGADRRTSTDDARISAATGNFGLLDHSRILRLFTQLRRALERRRLLHTDEPMVMLLGGHSLCKFEGYVSNISI